MGGARKGIYQHPIIQRSINKMWFKNRRDEGIEYEESFDPLPVPAIALMLTAVCIPSIAFISTQTFNSNRSRPTSTNGRQEYRLISPSTQMTTGRCTSNTSIRCWRLGRLPRNTIFWGVCSVRCTITDGNVLSFRFIDIQLISNHFT